MCMISERTIIANRANSLKSTGPRTPEGKQRVSRNAMKHGLFSETCVIEGEDRKQFEQLSDQMREELDPQGVLEAELVNIIVSCLWRLRRIFRIEQGIFELYSVYNRVDGGPSVAFANDARNLDCLGRLNRYETAMLKRLFKTLDQLSATQRSRKPAKESKPNPIARRMAGLCRQLILIR